MFYYFTDFEVPSGGGSAVIPRLVTLADNIVASLKSFSIDLSQNETLVISAAVRNFPGNVFVPFTVTRALQWTPQALAC
jgi:hypothetical protein